MALSDQDNTATRISDLATTRLATDARRCTAASVRARGHRDLHGAREAQAPRARRCHRAARRAAGLASLRREFSSCLARPRQTSGVGGRVTEATMPFACSCTIAVLPLSALLS